MWVRLVLTDSNEAHNFFVLHITETLELTFECKVQWRSMDGEMEWVMSCGGNIISLLAGHRRAGLYVRTRYLLEVAFGERERERCQTLKIRAT